MQVVADNVNQVRLISEWMTRFGWAHNVIGIRIETNYELRSDEWAMLKSAVRLNTPYNIDGIYPK